MMYVVAWCLDFGDFTTDYYERIEDRQKAWARYLEVTALPNTHTASICIEIFGTD